MKALKNAVVIPRDQLRPATDQPRKHFNAQALKELAASIQEHGLLEPLLVRREPSRYDGSGYVVIAGERRLRASEGILDELPCIVSDTGPDNHRVLALIENLQREDLSPREEASAIGQLIQDEGLSIRDCARRLGKSMGWVNNRRALLNLKPDAQTIAAKVPDAMSSLLLVDKLPDAELRRELLSEIESGESHAPIKARVEEYQSRGKPKPATVPDASRVSTFQRTGQASVSRGKPVTGASVAQSRQEAKLALERAGHNLEQAAGWIANLSERDRAALAKRYGLTLRRKLGELFP